MQIQEFTMICSVSINLTQVKICILIFVKLFFEINSLPLHDFEALIVQNFSLVLRDTLTSISTLRTAKIKHK